MEDNSKLYKYVPSDGTHVACIQGQRFMVMWTGAHCLVAVKQAVSMDVDGDLGFVIISTTPCELLPTNETEARVSALKAMAPVFFDDLLKITGRADVTVRLDGVERVEWPEHFVLCRP